MLLEGMFLPVMTPFGADERVYSRKLEVNVEHYSRTPVAGMVVLSAMGEPDALTDVEAAEVLTRAMGAAADNKVMIAAVGRESLSRTMTLAEVAAERGYDAVAVRGTRSVENWARAKETVNYFAMVADRSRLPVVLVSEHGRRLSVEIVSRLAEHPNVIGVITAGLADETEQIKIATASVKRNVTVTTVFAAATGRMLRVAETASGANLGGVAVLSARPAVRTRTKQVGFQVLSGSTTGMLEAWKAGASGAVPRLSVCAPQACCEVWQAYRDGDPALAEEKQERLRQAAAYLKADAEGDPAALKYGCDFNGYFGGRPRLPVLPILDDERVQVERVLAGMRN